MIIHFYVRGTKSDSATIWLTTCINYRRFSTSLHINVIPSCWDKEKERVKNKISQIDRDDINAYLDELTNKVNVFCLDRKRDNEIITIESISTFIKNLLNPKKIVSHTFSNFLDEYIKNNEIRPSKNTNRPLEKSTKQKFILFRTYFTEFCKKMKYQYSFEDFDDKFYNKFVDYLQGKELKPNTIGKNINTFKTILNQATADGLNTNLKYKSFKIFKEVPDDVYLTEEELEKIEKVPLTDELNKYRELFLIACYTGLRFSDYSRLTTDNIVNGNIEIRQQKTNEKVSIPLLHKDIMTWIRNRNQYGKIFEQHLNINIKEIAKQAGINNPIVVEYTKGGKRYSETKEKWQLISSHTGRRSLATNLHLNGINDVNIMAVTGHKDFKSFNRYIKLNNKEKAQLVKKELIKQGENI